jgi:hypothetical protein
MEPLGLGFLWRNLDLIPDQSRRPSSMSSPIVMSLPNVFSTEGFHCLDHLPNFGFWHCRHDGNQPGDRYALLRECELLSCENLLKQVVQSGRDLRRFYERHR